MSDFKVNLTVEVDRVANALLIQTPVPMQIEFERGKWSASCFDPPMRLGPMPTFDQAIMDGGRQIAAEMQASVYSRPMILARIGPEEIPAGFF